MSYAVAALSSPVTRLIRELFPTPVSPATMMFRMNASCVLQNVLARIVREFKTLALRISFSSSNLLTCLERDCYGTFLELQKREHSLCTTALEAQGEQRRRVARTILVALTSLAVLLELASPVI